MQVMKNNLKSSILTEQINNLSLSNNFKEMAEVNGFENLDEVLAFTLASLMNKPHFSMHVYYELHKFLEKEGYLSLLKIE